MHSVIHHPWQFSLGPLSLTGFGIAVLMAFMIAQVITQRELTRRGHDAEAQAVPDLVFASVLGMLLGGKLYYILVITRDWRDFFTRAGFVFWGGLMGGVLLCWLYIRYKRFSFARFSDVAGPAIMGAYSVGRTGCWAVGDDYGRPWTSRFAVAFPEGAPPSTAGIMERMFGTPVPSGATPDTVLAVHPTQLYETGLALLLFLVLWRLRDHKHAEGWLFGLYCVLAGLERFVVEFFRAKDDRLLGPLTIAQVIGLAIALIGVVVMVSRRGTGPGRAGIIAA